jgi:hypothetical protein
MRKFVVASIALLLSIGLALPAAADRPITVTQEDVFLDQNPCADPGVLHEVTIISELHIHQHPNNTVITIKRTGTTDSGFEMINGTAHVVDNGNIFTLGLTDLWHNPTTGERFLARFTLVVDLNESIVRAENGALICLS